MNPPINNQTYREASEWLVELRLEKDSRELRNRFQAWLKLSPAHVRAYLELTATWEDSSNFDAGRSVDVEALLASARTEANVVSLTEDGDPFAASPVHRYGNPGTRHFAIAASFALAIGLSAAIGLWNDHRGLYATGIGEQRTFTLGDGSVVVLNANTRIRERYTAQQRRVEFLQGEALFRVAKEPGRPFTVTSDTATVRALGTAFDIQRRSSSTTVTVLEGRVAAKNLAASAEEAQLSAGDQLTVGEKISAPPKRANITIATAWTKQQLIFESTSLPDAAEQFNRFNARKLIVEPHVLDDFLINGTFPALDPTSLPRFVRFLRDQPGIALEENDARVAVTKIR